MANRNYIPSIKVLNTHLAGKGIQVSEALANTKASDYFVRVTFTQSNGFKWETVVPYIYRRSGLNLSTDKEIADYLLKIKPYFSKNAMKLWKRTEWAKWEAEREKSKNSDKLVTINFFKVLLSFKEETIFPENPNPQRRFQDIKDRGYTLSIYPIGNRQWGKVLLPIPLNEEMGYETFSPQFKARVIRLLKGINAYESKKTAIKSLIPDHKFSEVRWDEKTKGENLMEMSDEEIIEKFQLLDNQRNQQKREVCRNCYQNGERGKLFGIDFYPEGGSKWDSNIPEIGKAAEKGCFGCPWYDIEAWRRKLNKLIASQKRKNKKN